MSKHQKKVLIVSLAAGSGHVQTARALKKTASLYFPNLQCKHIDIADYITPLLKKTTVAGYEFLVSHLPQVWSSLFRLTNNKAFIKTYRSLTDYLKMLNSFEFLNTVDSFNPDHIISTHFLPSEILAHAMKKRGQFVPITQIITDYGIHRMMVVDGVNNYIVSTHQMKQKLIDTFNITPSHIHEFGIPIDPIFYEPQKTDHTFSTHKLPKDRPVILILSGGSGLIEISKVVEQLFLHISYPVTILAIAGQNKKLHEKLSSLKNPPHITYRAFGWSDEVPNFMAIAKVIISKPGGLTTTEAYCAGVPMIAINPIPGQEEYNIHFLEENQAGSYAKTTSEIISLLNFYCLEKQYTKNRSVVRSGNHILEFISHYRA